MNKVAMWCLALLLTILQCVQSQELEDVETLGTGRQIQLQNVSLVITYTGIVVAALMMAGFLYIAVNFGRGRRYGYYAEDDYYDYGGHYGNGGYHYSKRSIEDVPTILSEMFSQLNKYEKEED